MLGGFRRMHGLHRPFHPLQLISWTLFPFFTALFYGVCIPNLNSVALQASLGTIVGVLGVITAFLGYKAAKIDPGSNEVQSTVDHRFCEFCKIRVNEEALHCRECNKCIDHFDHHCFWLNNCVGSKNYKYFFSLLVSTSLFLALQTASAAYALYVSIEILHLYQKGPSEMASFVFLVIFLFLVFLTLANMLHLLGFHIMLIIRGVTTYQHLTGYVKKEKAAKKKSEQKNKRKLKDMLSLKKRDGSKSSLNGTSIKHKDLREVENGLQAARPHSDVHAFRENSMNSVDSHKSDSERKNDEFLRDVTLGSDDEEDDGEHMIGNARQHSRDSERSQSVPGGTINVSVPDEIDVENTANGTSNTSERDVEETKRELTVV